MIFVLCYQASEILLLKCLSFYHNLFSFFKTILWTFQRSSDKINYKTSIDIYREGKYIYYSMTLLSHYCNKT